MEKGGKRDIWNKQIGGIKRRRKNEDEKRGKIDWVCSFWWYFGGQVLPRWAHYFMIMSRAWSLTSICNDGEERLRRREGKKWDEGKKKKANEEKIIKRGGKCLIEGFGTDWGIKIESLRLSATGALKLNLSEATGNWMLSLKIPCKSSHSLTLTPSQTQ